MRQLYLKGFPIWEFFPYGDKLSQERVCSHSLKFSACFKMCPLPSAHISTKSSISFYLRTEAADEESCTWQRIPGQPGLRCGWGFAASSWTVSPFPQPARFWVMIYSCCRPGSNLPSYSQSLPASSSLARREWKVNRQMGLQIKLQNQSDLSLQITQARGNPGAGLSSWDDRWRMLSTAFTAGKGKLARAVASNGGVHRVCNHPAAQATAAASEWIHSSGVQTSRGSVLTDLQVKLLLSPRFGCTTTQGSVCNKQCHSDCKMKH